MEKRRGESRWREKEKKRRGGRMVRKVAQLTPNAELILALNLAKIAPLKHPLAGQLLLLKSPQFDKHHSP